MHQWLKHYVNARVITPGKRPGAKETAITFMVSAFWHGLYPFYYFMFFACAIFVEFCKEIYKSQILFNFIPEPFGYWIAVSGTMFTLNYLGTSFNMLTFERGHNFAKATNYLIWIYVPVLFFFVRAIGLSGIAKKKLAKIAASKEKKDS